MAAYVGAMDDVRDAVAEIEDRIEALEQSVERCRKLSLAAKIALGAGSTWIVLTLLGIAPFVPYLIVAALAAVIGGLVLLGSNSTTWTQTESALRAAEAMRLDLIGRIAMRVVGEESPTLH